METIFNIFTICNDGIIENIGFKAHEQNGSDDEKIKFLQNNVQSDSSDLKYRGQYINTYLSGSKYI